MWLDILRLFPTATVMGPGRATGNGGRAKRSATFPGIRIMSPASRFANNKAALSAMTNKNAEGNEVEDAAEDGDVADCMAGKGLIFLFTSNRLPSTYSRDHNCLRENDWYYLYFNLKCQKTK